MVYPRKITFWNSDDRLRPLQNLFSLAGIPFSTHLRACLLNRKNSPPAADQTVCDSPRLGGARSPRPGGCPEKPMMCVRRHLAKVSDHPTWGRFPEGVLRRVFSCFGGIGEATDSAPKGLSHATRLQMPLILEARERFLPLYDNMLWPLDKKQLYMVKKPAYRPVVGLAGRLVALLMIGANNHTDIRGR